MQQDEDDMPTNTTLYTFLSLGLVIVVFFACYIKIKHTSD